MESSDLAREATARRQIAAASRLRLRAPDPWTGGNGPAAGRLIRQHLRPPLLLEEVDEADLASPWR